MKPDVWVTLSDRFQRRRHHMVLIDSTSSSDVHR